MEDKKDTIGKVTKRMFFSVYVGDGETPDGKKFELLINAGSSAPIVQHEDKKFYLTWNDILTLAEKAGLFEKEVKNEEENF